MSSVLKAGALYFAVVFAIGFLLGTVRVLILVPQFGETVAVALEGPVILIASWLVCTRVIKSVGVSGGWAPRLFMGATAFILLMIAEFGLAIFVFGRTPSTHIESYRTAAGILGLAGQTVFALFPTVQWRMGVA